MNQKPDPSIPPEGSEAYEDNFAKERRKLLKTVIASAGAAAGISILPDRWIRPVVEIATLPAHAQTSPPPRPQPGSQTFSSSGNFTVPALVTSLTIDAYGAQGGAGVGSGGLGGRITATITVTPGETLAVNVGGQGSSFPIRPGTGGANGGGASTGDGGGGGGRSEVLRGATPLVIAGGGGGGGTPEDGAAGGAGGGATGGTGVTSGGGAGGTGGTEGAGGAGGAGANGGTPGTNGVSGTGGTGGSQGLFYGGGGGGGGYYGGGGGGGGGNANDTGVSGGGGGGGSSYAILGATGVSHSQGVRSGNGQVIISW